MEILGGPRRLCAGVSTSQIKLEAGEDTKSGLAGSIAGAASTVPRRSHPE